MKKINLFKNPFNGSVSVGFRLFLAGIILFLGVQSGFALASMVLAAIVMKFPSFNFNPRYLFDGPTPEEQEEKLLEKIQGKVQSIVDTSNKGVVTKVALDAEVEKLNKMIEKLSTEGMAALKQRVDAMAEANEKITKSLGEATEALNVQSAALKKLTDKGVATPEARKSFKDAIRDAIMANKDALMLVEKNDDYGQRFSLKNYFDGKGKGASTPAITIKAAVDMLQSNIVGAEVANIRLTELDAQRVGIPLTIYPHVTDVFMKKGITRPYMSLLVVYEYFDGVATKTEGGASGQSSFKFKTVEFKAFYIAAHFILSDETLDDLEEALDEIAIVAPDTILDAIDSKILSDDGDDSTDIKGILHADKSTAYATAMGAASVDDAYIVDVIADAKLQAENNKLRPNVVYLSPTEVAKLAAKKNTLEDSKSDKRVTYNNLGEATGVCGLAIIKSAAFPNNECLVFDNRQPWIGQRRDISMEIGYNGTDLTEGQKTVVFKCRLAFGVRNKLGVIYVSDIIAAAAALTSGA